MARRKTKLSELIEFFFQKTDRRVRFGKQAEKAINSWVEAKNTSRLSLLRGLVLEYQVEHLDDLPGKLEKSDDFYVPRVEGNCMCGQPFSRESVLLNVKGGNEAKNKIYGRIKAEKEINARDSSAVGMDCYDRLPELFDELQIPHNLKKSRKNAKESKEEKLQKIVSNISPDLQAKLKAAGINPCDLKKVLELEHAQRLIDGDESGLKFDIDKRNSTNTFNWFKGLKESAVREGINPDYREDLIRILEGLNKAAHLVSNEDLAEIMVYSHEFRHRKTDLLLAGVKKDLLYLSNLESNHPHVKQYGVINIDKPFVLPKTKYRKDRSNLPKRTIRDVLEQDYVTRVEAMGVHNHFEDIVERRIAINREFVDRYDSPQKMFHIVNALERVFKAEKGELHQDFKKWGEIVRAHMFTKMEYTRLKYFLRRANVGQDTKRKNYLRNHHIAHFRHVVPEIITMYRKLQYARKLRRQKSSVLQINPLKQEYFLKEDFIETFNSYTGLKSMQHEEFLDLVRHTGFIEHKTYQKFREKLLGGDEIRLVPRELVKQTGNNKMTPFQRYFNMLKKKGITKVDSEVLKKAEHLKDLDRAGVISSIRDLNLKKLTGKWDKELADKVNKVYEGIKDVKVPEESIKDDVEALRHDKRKVIRIKNNALGISGIYHHLAVEKSPTSQWYGTWYYDAKKIKEMRAEQDKMLLMPVKVLKKLLAVSDHRIGKHIHRASHEKERLEEFIEEFDKEVYATQETIDLINTKYTVVEKKAKEIESIDKRRAIIQEKWPIENISSQFIRSHEKLTEFFARISGLEEHLCEKYSEFDIERDTLKAKDQWDAGGDVEDKYFDALRKFDVRKKKATEEIYEKTGESSVIIRKGLKYEDPKKFFMEHLLPELTKYEHLWRVGKGLGAQKRTGERVLGTYYYSYQEKYDKYNLQRTLQGLDNVISGKKEKFEFSKVIKARFEDDVKTGRIKENDVEKYRNTLAQIEDIVNMKILGVYSLENQLKLLEKSYTPPPMPPPTSRRPSGLRGYSRRSYPKRRRRRRF